MARNNSAGIASYPEYAQASAGGATYPVFASISETNAQVNPNARLQWGDRIKDKWGNSYVYVRAAQALTVGNVVKQCVAGVGDIPAAGTISASTTAKRIFSNITTTLDESSFFPYAFLASPGPTTPFVKPVKDQVAVGANTTFDISKLQIFFGIGQYDGDALSAVPTTGESLSLIRLYNVVVNGAAATGTNCPVGVATATVSTVGNGTLIQTSGIAQVIVDGTTDVTAGSILVGAASGATAMSTATPTALEVLGQVGRALIAQTDDSSKLSAVLLQLEGRI